MGVDFFPCGLCKEVICDAGDYYNCSKCRSNVCEDCYQSQKKKYHTVIKNKELSDYWGSDALKECDKCSDKTKNKRIKELEEQLAKLKAKK